MTISVNPLTVAASIANLSVSGVTIKKTDNIPDSASMICPIIIPQPSGFISNIAPENVSFGSMGSQKENFSYSLNYVFLFAEIGSGINAYAPYDAALAKLMVALNVILNNDTVSGLVDMQLEEVSTIGAIDDPYGNPYWGALFSLRCLEFGQ
jgi:hypothetical protein